MKTCESEVGAHQQFPVKTREEERGETQRRKKVRRLILLCKRVVMLVPRD